MAVLWHPTEDCIISSLSDGCAKSSRQVVQETGIGEDAVDRGLRRCWEKGLVLRTASPLRERSRLFKGRAGVSVNLRSYHLYVLRPEGKESLELEGRRFVPYSKRYLDRRRGGGKSKARLVYAFLEKNRDRAFYSKDVAEALKDKGVRTPDVMCAARRLEKKGLIYVRGYNSHDRQTPFKAGYLLTWVDQGKPREESLKEAVEKTNTALSGDHATYPVIERIHIIRDQIIAATQLRDLVSFNFLQEKLGCTERETELAVKRALQLYPDLKEVKVFNNYKYYHHQAMSPENLAAALALKENYIRVVKGRDNRVGHNWEAVVEWFIDKFTVGANFQTQDHREKNIDPRRITLYLLKPVGERRSAAEVDRVWTVTPGVFSQPITYILECKWGLIRKRDVDEFFDVLRWSKEFGIDTENGRAIRQGIIGVFAGGAFNPEEKIHLKDESISLAAYASRMNIQLLKASDFNGKLHERGCSQRVTAQKICERAKDEGEIREVLEALWDKPKTAETILAKLAEKNQAIYEFERKLQEGSTNPTVA